MEHFEKILIWLEEATTCCYGNDAISIKPSTTSLATLMQTGTKMSIVNKMVARKDLKTRNYG